MLPIERKINHNTSKIKFQLVLDAMAEGYSLIDATSLHDIEDKRLFLAWVYASPERKKSYHLAQELQAEVIANDLIAIADETEERRSSIERNALRIETRKYILGAHYKKRYSPHKTVAMDQTFSAKIALEEAQKRVTTTQNAQDRKTLDHTRLSLPDPSRQ